MIKIPIPYFRSPSPLSTPHSPFSLGLIPTSQLLITEKPDSLLNNRKLRVFLWQTWIDNVTYLTSTTMTDNIQRGSRGPAPNWNLGRTKTIRVPIALADQLIQIARKIDRGESIDPEMLLTKEDTEELSKSSHSTDRAC